MQGGYITIRSTIFRQIPTPMHLASGSNEARRLTLKTGKRLLIRRLKSTYREVCRWIFLTGSWIISNQTLIYIQRLGSICWEMGTVSPFDQLPAHHPNDTWKGL